MVETAAVLAGLYGLKIAITWPLGSLVAAKLKARPRYAVIKPLCAVERGHRHPRAELRAYKAFLVAEVTVDDAKDASAATAKAAKLLKKYIHGDNAVADQDELQLEQRRQKGKRLAITSLLRRETSPPSRSAGEAADNDDAQTPDESNKIDEEDAAFAGVEPRGGAGALSYRISFVLPSKHTVATLPRPKPPIAIRIEEPEIVASYRFRGNSPAEATVRLHADKLRTLLVEHGLQTDGRVVLTQYHPKRAPRWMRVNEVLMHVTNFGVKYGQEAEEGAKQAADLAGEQSDSWSDEEDEADKAKPQSFSG